MKWNLATACVSIVALGMAFNSWADALTEQMRALDAQLFDSFNRCAEPTQLAKHGGFFAVDVEFYHDQGGVTWDRASMLANTRDNACGNYTRHIQAETFQAFPIANFGAITRGVHRFCKRGADGCEGQADFVIVWQQQPEGWRVTRVLSFAHRATSQGAATQRTESLINASQATGASQ